MVPLHAPFEIVLRGFDRRQVLDHIESLEDRMAMIAADRDAALRQAADLSKLLEHLRREAEEATMRVERLQRSSLGGAGVRIQRMLQVAEDEITALQASTERDITSLRERARAEADRLVQETMQRCERMEAQATARIREYQTWGMAGLHLILRIAGEGLNRRMVEIEREITRCTELRAHVNAALASVHRALVEAVAQVEQPTAIEPGAASADQAGRGAGGRDG